MSTNNDSDSLTGIVLGTLAAIVFAVWALLRDDGEGATVVDKLGDGITDIYSSVVQGTRVTHAPYSKVTGIVPGTPAVLAASAGVDVDTYSLARALASEEGNSSTATQVAVAWAINNHASQAGTSITQLVTHAKLASHSGLYGTQRNIEVGTAGYNGSDRYCSTANDPYAGHIQVAQGVLDGTFADPTSGADQFDRPSGESNPGQVAANRLDSGSELVDVAGTDGDIRFWRKV
jgi:hypothetical protein